MRNRAKCKKCQSIIESFYLNDYVTCKCGCITIYGGQTHFKCQVADWDYFLRVDDEGNEIIPTICNKEKEQVLEKLHGSEPEKYEQIESSVQVEDLLKCLKEMLNNLENLPSHAKSLPVTQYEFEALIGLLHMILESLNKVTKT